MTPTEYREEHDRLLALIRALRSDIADPVNHMQRIDKLRQQIAALEDQLASAVERQAQLPELLASAMVRMAKLKQTHVESANEGKIRRLLELRALVDELTKDID